MSVSEIHESLGKFSVKLKPNVPRDVLDRIEYFGHIAFIPGRMDARVYGDATLDSARYVGVVRKKRVTDTRGSSSINLNNPEMAGTNVTVEGVGMNFWLGDEDDKGTVIEDEIQIVENNFYDTINNLLPPAVTIGSVGGVEGSYSGTFQWQTPRKAIQYVCDTMSQPSSPYNLLSTDNSSFETSAGVSGWTSANALTYPNPYWTMWGAYAYGTGTISPGLPTGWQANDVFILIVEFDGTDNPTISINGWTQIGTTQRVTASVGTKTGCAVFYRRATSTEVAPTVPDLGDHASAIIHGFRGCKTTGSPVNTSAGTTFSTEANSSTFPSVTTTVNNCTILSVMTHGLDTSSTNFTFTNAGNLENLTKVSDNSHTDGTGGGIGAATSVKVTAGSTSTNPTVSLTNSSARAAFTIALEPDTTYAAYDTSYLNTRSMRVTPLNTGNIAVTTNGAGNAVDIDQGNTYVAYYWVQATANGGWARVDIDYKDAGYGAVSSAPAGEWVQLPVGSWTQVARTFTVPTGVGIDKAAFVLTLAASALTDRFYVDNVFLYESTEESPITFRVNNRGELDAGPESNLFTTIPECILVRQGSLQGEDMRIRAVPGNLGMDQDMEDFATRVVVLAESDGYQFTTGQADVGSLSPGTNVYKDIHGNPLNLTKMVSESQTDEDNADTRAELALREILTPHREITLDTQDFDVYGTFGVGDYVYVYDPDAGLVDTANEITIRGVRVNPLKLQVTESEWSIVDDYSVAYRAPDGTWYDLTDYAEFEDDRNTRVTIGNFKRTLDNNLQSVSSRVGSNAAPDNKTPAQVDWVLGSFQTVAYLDGSGSAKAQQKLAWNTPLNDDGSLVTDGAYYEIQYKLNTEHLYSQTWGAVANLTWDDLFTWNQPVESTAVDWETRIVQWGTNTLVINDLASGTAYDYRIRAIDNSNNQGEWSAVETVVAAEDDIPPTQPAAPEVAASLIAIQVRHDLGQISGGTFNLERDLAYFEVHAEYEPGFYPSEDTLLGKLIANSSMLDSSTPVVATFQVANTTALYVKVVAVDRSGNKSSPSPASEVTAQLIDDAHISDLTVSKITAGEITADWILSASIKTGIDGRRMEISSTGIQAYNADGDLTTNLASDPTLANDFISWRGNDGAIIASVNSLGTGSFQNVTVVNSLEVQGTDILEELQKRPKGVVAYGNWSSTTYDITMPTASEYGYMEVSFIAEESRMYRISLFGETSSNVANNRPGWNIRYTTDGSRPTTSSTILTHEIFYNGAVADQRVTQSFSHFRTFSPGLVRLLWSMEGDAGSLQTTYASVGPSQFVVEDAGDISLFDNVAVLNDGQPDSTTTTPGGGGVITKTKTYESTWTRSYIGDGDLRPDLYISRMYQGRYSSNYGQQKSLIGFDFQGMWTDLQNTTIKKVELYLYAQHWYSDYGTAVIGTHVYNSPPGYWEDVWVEENRQQVTGWNTSTGKWVDLGLDIGNDLKDATATGIALGPGPSTSTLYYGYFAGVSDTTNKPKLRITYTSS